PFVAHWPKGIRQPGMFTDDVGHIVDIMATCVAVAGAPYPNLYHDQKITPLRGTSLLPAFQGADLGQRTFCWEHFGKWAIRQGHWKLVGGRRVNQPALYNLADDPVELKDLSNQYPD